jgi:branched-chain amino acid transport system substrate-binding protein
LRVEKEEVRMRLTRRAFVLFAFAVAAVIIVLFLVTHLHKKGKEPIKIGLVTTLTGPASTAGICTRNGALLAIEQVNERGGVNGRRVEAIVRDDKADPSRALRVDTELINEGVVAFLGHYLSSVTVKVVPLMNERSMLMLSLGAATGDLYGLDDSFVRICLSNNVRTPLAASETYQRLGVRKVAVVCDLSNAAYTLSVHDLYRAEFERQGGEVVKTVTFYSGEGFNAPVIAEDLVGSGAEGIFIISDALHGALVCQHVRKRSASIPIIACAWASVVPEFIRYGGRAVEGVLSIVECNDASITPTYLLFKQAYQDRFGQEPRLHAQNAYDAAIILLKTLEKTTDPNRLKEELLTQGEFQGVDGTIRFDRNGEPIRPVYLMQIQNGRMQVIATLNSVIVEE